MTTPKKPRRRRSDAKLQAVRATRPTRTVLFVDDEPYVARAFDRTMRSSGHEIVCADGAESALALARARSLDVVVTDLRMPGMDGLTLIERLRSVQPDLVFLIVTGIPDLDLRRSGETDASILATLPKPWDDAELRDMVARAVDIHDRRLARRERLPDGSLGILVVDDDPYDPKLLKRWIERDCRASVEIVQRVSEAEVLLSQRPADVVIADLSLPDARGVDAVRRIRRAAPRSAVVITSRIADETMAKQAMRLGAQDFLVKGRFDPHRLRRAIEYSLEREAFVGGLVDLAHFDQLTGLANRRTLRDRYVHARSVARESGTRLGFLSIDLDRFKTINDTLGHEAGDALLQEVARRLHVGVRDHDTVARLGGDEFAVLLTELEKPEEAAIVAERLLAAMNVPIELPQATVLVTMSVGVIVPEEQSTLDDLLRSADESMYQAKRAGRNRLVQAGLVCSQSRDRLTLEKELADAVHERRFTLAYQPQYAVTDGRITGFEALMRWTREDGTRVSPGVFIPLLEELGLISELGAWLVDEACAELRRWRDDDEPPNVRMAVNLSGHQFDRPGLVASIEAALEKHGIEPEALELEITENVLMRDTEQTGRTLNALRDLGARVAIDDFGTGYSSLAYLQRFRVSTLKVDRCFIEQLDEDNRSACIASAVIGLGQRLGMEIVAEGVETRSQLDSLRAEGCDVAQGFLLAKPLPSTRPFGFVQRLAS